jgi:hypothetical protein
METTVSPRPTLMRLGRRGLGGATASVPCISRDSDSVISNRSRAYARSANGQTGSLETLLLPRSGDVWGLVPPAVFKTVCGALLRRPGWVRFPSIPAICQARPRRLREFAASDGPRRRELTFFGRARLICCPTGPPSTIADRSSAAADQRMS